MANGKSPLMYFVITNTSRFQRFQCWHLIESGFCCGWIWFQRWLDGHVHDKDYRRWIFVAKVTPGSRSRSWHLRCAPHSLWQCHHVASYSVAFSLGTRSSWLNCALRDDEAVNWVSIGHYEAVAIGNWWYWVSRGHLCLYILHKVEIWTGVTNAWLTDSLTHWQTLKDRAT